MMNYPFGSKKFKKRYLILLLCSSIITDYVLAAQQPLNAVPKSTASNAITVVRDGINTELAKQQTMNTELYSADLLKADKSCFDDASTFNACFGLDWITGGTFDQTGNYTVTGAWDFTGATVTGLPGASYTAGTDISISGGTISLSWDKDYADLINTPTTAPLTVSMITGLFTGTEDCLGANGETVACGGSGGYTNLTEFVGQTAWRLFYSNGSGDIQELALGSSGTVLKSNGTSAAPSFQADATAEGAGYVSTPPTYSDETCTAGQYYNSTAPLRLYSCLGDKWVYIDSTGLVDWNNPTPVTPTLTAMVIGTDGTTLTLTGSASLSVGAGGNGGFDVDCATSGNGITATYASGAPGTDLVYTLGTTVNSSDTCDLDYTQPGNGIEATTGGADLASITSAAVANNSTHVAGATYGPELHIAANAAAPSASDTDATTGFTGTGLATFDSIDTAPYIGTYHLTAVANGDADRVSYDMSGLTTGSLYRVKAAVRHNGTGGDWIMGFGVSNAGPQTSQSKIIATEDITYFAYDRYFYSTPYTNYFVAKESEADNGGIYLDAFSLTPVTSPCIGPELYTAANAASITNEADAAQVTGWANTAVDTFASVSTGTPDNGTYHLEIAEVATPTASARVTFDLSTLSLVDGKSYLISVKVKHSGTGETWNIALNSTDAASTSNTIATVPVANTSYLIKGMEFVYSASVRYLVIYEAGASVESRIYVDSISVREILSK